MNNWHIHVAAARNGDIPALESALSSGVPINFASAPVYNPQISADTGDLTMLMYAAANGQTAAVTFLLDRGAAIDQSDGEGMTALHYAIQRKQSETMKVLVNRGASLDHVSIGGSVLTLVSKSMGPEDMEFLLTHGASANEPVGDGKTPLVAAAENLRPDLVRVLLEHGADPDKPDPRGRTPFGIATRNHCRACLLALQKPSETDPQRMLYNAAQSGDLEGIRSAIALGAQLNGLPKPDSNGGDASALMYASMCGQLEAAALLLDLGAPVDQVSEFGVTAVHCAVSNKHIEVVKLLVDRGGANLKLDAMYDGPPLSLAALRGSAEIVAYLVEHGAPIDAIRKWGDTALTDAVVQNNFEAARVLLEHGADPNRRSRDGTSALQMAVRTGKFKTPEFHEWKALFKR